MSKEIITQFSLSYTRGTSQFAIPGRQISTDAIDPEKIMATQQIGTTYEAINVGDVSNLGAIYVQNVGTTNFIEIGIEVSSAFHPLIQLEPGQYAFIPRLASTPFAKSDTAAEPLEYMLFSQ